MFHRTLIWRLTGVSAVILSLTGCLGGGGASEPVVATPTPEPINDPLMSVPASASASVSGTLSYQFIVLSVPASATDRAEPIDVSALSLPTSDVTEPADV